MQVTIKGTSPTDTLDEGEVRTVELTPYVRNLIRNGLAVQVPRVIPDPAEVKPVPAKKAPAKKAAAKKAGKPVEEFDNGGIGSGMELMAKNVVEPERVLSSDKTKAFDRLSDAITDEE